MDPRAGLYRRSSHSSRHHGSGSRESRLKKKLLITRLFTIATLAAIVALSILLIRSNAHLQSFNAESSSLASELQRTQFELDETKRLVTAQEKELGTLVKQRIPGVLPLELDKLYDIGKGMVKKISFSESGVGEDRRLSYYALLKNSASTPAEPDVTVLLFNRVGLQIGSARITKESANHKTENGALAPGEKRTYSATIDRSIAEAPRFFLVTQR